MSDPIAQVMFDEAGAPDVEVSSPEVRGVTDLVELVPLSSMLNMHTPNGEQTSQLKTIWDYFADGAQGQADALFRVREAERRLSETKLGESRLSKLYNYVKQKNIIKQAEEVIDGL